MRVAGSMTGGGCYEVGWHEGDQAALGILLSYLVGGWLRIAERNFDHGVQYDRTTVPRKDIVSKDLHGQNLV